jgi:hypothetical protein
MAKMTRHVGYIHDSKLEPFSLPCFCQSGVGLEEYSYHYQKGHARLRASLTSYSSGTSHCGWRPKGGVKKGA